jgi:5,10-methylenetetrahydromethanopterin reductase
MKHEISIAFQTDKSASEYIELAQLVNHYAFDAVSVYCDLPFHTPYVPLALMAPHLQHARIGVAANSPSRIHPLDIAAQTALLYQIAQGGVYVGVARGAWLSEHGITEKRPVINAIKEAVELIRYMLEGDSGGYAGTVYNLASHITAPYPLPPEKIPILIGSWGRLLCGLAGEIDDEVKVGGSANPDIVPVIKQFIETGEMKAGRPSGTVGIVVGAVSVIDPDGDQARNTAKHALAPYLPVVASLDPTVNLEPELIDRLQQYNQQGRKEDAAKLISDGILEKFAFAGNAHDFIRQAEMLFASGVKRVEFGTPHGINSRSGIRMIGEQVLPALAQFRR